MLFGEKAPKTDQLYDVPKAKATLSRPFSLLKITNVPVALRGFQKELI